MPSEECCIVGCHDEATVTAESDDEALEGDTFAYCDYHWEEKSREYSDLQEVSDD